MADLSNWGQLGALTDKVPYGQHIPLACRNHPHLRWSTKNIAPIGARSIFYKSDERECDCSAFDLYVVEDEIKAES